jgi:hypothetical protein
MFRKSRRSPLAGSIVIRPSRPGDEPALERLAALEGRRLAGESFVLAEVGGELVAAAPADGRGEPIADPFRPTADLVEVLRLCVRRRGSRRRVALRGRWAALPEAA